MALLEFLYERELLRESDIKRAVVDSNADRNSSTNIPICMSTFDETSKAHFYAG